MTMTKPTSEQVTFTAAGSGATLRNLVDKVREVVSVKDFGAAGDGVVDDTQAINAAAASGAKMIRLPAGTYKVTASILLPRNVSMVGDGVGSTVIDGSTALPANVQFGHIIVQEGTWVQLPDLSANVAAGTESLTFASDPQLSVDDIVCIYNPASGSWNPVGTTWKAGEMQKVALSSGTSVTLQGGLFESYVAADVDVYVLADASSATLADFSVRCLAPTTTPEYAFGISLESARDCTIRNVKVANASYSGIHIVRSYNVFVDNCIVQEDAAVTHGTDYGIDILNSTNVFVNGGYYFAARHAIATGGTGGVCNVPVRFVEYTNLTAVANSTSVGALDFHPNSEFCTIDSCFVDGGIIAGGDRIQITNSTIVGRGLSNCPIVFPESMRGSSILIDGNRVETHYFGSLPRAAVVDISLPATMQVGGVIAITNNVFEISNEIDTAAPNRAWGRIANAGATVNDIVISVHGNSITARSYPIRGELRIRATGTATPYAFVGVKDNIAYNCGLVSMLHGDSTLPVALDVHVTGNTVINADPGLVGRGVYAIRIEDASQSAVVEGNVIRKCAETPIIVAGNSTVPLATASVTSNTIIDGLRVNTGSATTNTDIFIEHATACVCTGNMVGTANANRSYGISLSNIGSMLFRDNTAWQSSNSGTYTNAVTAYLPGSVLEGSATYDPPNLVDGDGATTTVTVTGAALGDLVDSVSFSLDLQGITVTGYVSAANTVSVRLQNESGGTLDLGSGTLRVRVRKA